MIDSKLEVKNNRNKSSEKELEVSNWASVAQADKVWKQKSAKKLQLILLNNSVCQSRSPFIVYKSVEVQFWHNQHQQQHFVVKNQIV